MTSSLAHRSLYRLLADLEEATSRIIEQHYTEDEAGENVLKHYGPFGVYVTGIDGTVARFLEEGIERFPEGEVKP